MCRSRTHTCISPARRMTRCCQGTGSFAATIRTCRRHSQSIPDRCVHGKAISSAKRTWVIDDFAHQATTGGPGAVGRKTTLAGSSKNILPPSRVMVLPGRRCGFGKFASFRGTNSSLQLMWEAHQAERWMFGAPSFVVRSSRQRDALCLLGAGRGILICRCTAPARSARASPGRACFVRSCAKRASLRPNSPPAFEP